MSTTIPISLHSSQASASTSGSGPGPSTSGAMNLKTLGRLRASFVTLRSGGKDKDKGKGKEKEHDDAKAGRIVGANDASTVLGRHKSKDKRKEKETRGDTQNLESENGHPFTNTTNTSDAISAVEKEKDKDKGSKDRGKLYSARMGLSKVGLRRLGSREQTGLGGAIAGTGTSVSRGRVEGGNAERTVRERDREERTVKPNSPETPSTPQRSQGAPGFVYLAQASASTPLLHSSNPPRRHGSSNSNTGTGKVGPVLEEGISRKAERGREKEKEKEKERYNERKLSISGPSPLSARRDRERTRDRERPPRPPTPPSPTPPHRSSSSNSTALRNRLTSPSSPSLLPSPTTPTRHKPAPLQFTGTTSSRGSGVSPMSGSMTASTSTTSSGRGVGVGLGIGYPTSSRDGRTVSPPASPTSASFHPQVHSHSSSTSSTPAAQQPTTPTKTRHRERDPALSRPPLSPSASANAGGRIRLRLVMGGSGSGSGGSGQSVPIDVGGSGGSMSASTGSVSTVGSGSTSVSAGTEVAGSIGGSRRGRTSADGSAVSANTGISGGRSSAERERTSRRSSLDSRTGVASPTPPRRSRDRDVTPPSVYSSRRPHQGIGSASMTSLPLQTSATPHTPVQRTPRTSTSTTATTRVAARSRSPPPSPTTTRLLPTPRAVTSGLGSSTVGSPPALSSSPPEYRDTLRHAASLLLRELADPRLCPLTSSTSTPVSISKAGRVSPPLSPEVWVECERRLGALSRSERMWAKSTGPYRPGVGTSQSTVSLVSPSVVNSGDQTEVGGGAGSGFSGGGSEERERKLFAEAVRDGYVLCQLINKLRPGTIPRVDPREDGFRRTSNVTSFLAAAKGHIGVSERELFRRDDLLECTPEGLFRVARTIVAIVRVAGDEGTLLEKMEAKKIQGTGRGMSLGVDKDEGTHHQHPNSPYGTARSKGASVSTPNLAIATTQWTNVPLSPSPTKKRWALVSPLPTVRSDSPDEAQSKVSKASGLTPHPARDQRSLTSAQMEGSAIVSDSEEDDERFFDASASMGPRTPVSPQHPQASALDRPAASAAGLPTLAPSGRVSIASGVTHTTAHSSLLATGRMSMPEERASNTFGTMRTVTTVATTIPPSEVNSVAYPDPGRDVLSRQRSLDGYSGGTRPLLSTQERRPSETVPVDLSRVVEESDEVGGLMRRESERKPVKSRPQPIQLKKGKWPEDFLDLMNAPSPTRPIPIKRATMDDVSPLPSSSPRKVSPLSNVLHTAAGGSSESLSQLAPRRPSTRPRHSLDAPSGLAREIGFGRESSPGPDGILSTSRLVPRRASTKVNPANRNGMYVPRSGSASPSPDGLAGVPFPRSVSGDHTGPGPVDTSFIGNPNRISRGRFNSEVESGTRRKPRPSSFDELGAKPSRSRIESMISLGAVSSNFSASDLRSSVDGSFVRKTLIVKEDGKSATHYQLGNCIGKGQFGAVYRALNLNTGQMVAVKRISLAGLSENDIKQLMREVDVVKSLSHPSIVKYEGMLRDADTLNIILEYAENGSLGQILKAFGKLNEKLVATYVMKILEGLDYLHRNDVVHCDLKAANILTTKHGNVKLSDFGVSLNMRNVGREAKPDVAGTPNWMAPEVIELKGASPASDIWSLACTVIELLTGRPPYSDIPNGMSVMFHIVEDPVPPIPDDFSEPLKDFLKSCFRKDPSERPNAEQLCEHRWLKNHWGIHKELRPQDSIPFLRRVSADLQRSEAVRLLADVDALRSESRQTERKDTPEESSMIGNARRSTDSPRPPLNRSSNGPSSVKFENESPLVREHSFVKTSFSRSVLCRICMQPVKRHALVCEDCTLISHASCAPNAPPTCGVRTQLLQYADSRENSPSPLDILHQFSPPTSPGLDLSGQQSPLSQLHSPSPDPNLSPPPPPFKMFGAFRRSKSPALVDNVLSQNRSSGSSQDSVAKNTGMGTVGTTSTHVANGATIASRDSRPRRPSLLLKPSHARPRPLSLSSEGTPPNRSSLHSAATIGDSEDLSQSSRDHSRSQSLNNHSARGRTEISFSNFSTETNPRPRYTRSRRSQNQSISIIEPLPRESVLAPSTVAAEFGDGDGDRDDPQDHDTHADSKRKDSRPGCVIQ